MNFYNLNSDVAINVTFLTVANSQPVDPDEVSLYVKPPEGEQTKYTYPAEITRSGVGIYSLTVTTVVAGTWVYKWQGSGNVKVMSDDVEFAVRATSIDLEV